MLKYFDLTFYANEGASFLDQMPTWLSTGLKSLIHESLVSWFHVVGMFSVDLQPVGPVGHQHRSGLWKG